MIRDVKRSQVCGATITVIYQINKENAYQPTYYEVGPPSRIVVNTIDRTYKLQALSEFGNDW